MSLVLVTTMLAGCSGSGPTDRPPPVDFGDEPNDTFPQFYGRVPKNIVMISIDTFRKDHLDRYSTKTITPFLSNLADEGVVLDDFVQCSNWTYAATSCTLSGRYNWEAGFGPVLSDEHRAPWPPGTPFLAGHLGDAGYYSILSSANGWLGPEWQNTQGYNEAYHPANASAYAMYEEARGKLDVAIGKGQADKWFLHLHLVEPHASYDPPATYLSALDDLEEVPWDLTDRDTHYSAARQAWPTMTPDQQDLLEQHLRVRYEGELSHVDDMVFLIYQDMVVNGMLDDALLVVWTNHGEAFWEHGYQTHAYTMHREENDAMAFFWSRNIVPAAVTAPTMATDLTPTLLELHGIEASEPTGTPLSQTPDDRARLAWSLARLGGAQTIQKDGWKMIFSWYGTIWLYDLNTDPLEQNNLYSALNPHPKAFELWAELEPAVQAAEPLTEAFSVNWPEELQAGSTP